MNHQSIDSPAADGAEIYPEALQAPLVRFFFETDQWVMPSALLAQLKPGEGFDWPAVMTPAALRRIVADRYLTSRLSLSLLTDDLSGRLALLPRSEWLRLGTCISLLPFCGRIRVSMDGHLRRVVRDQLNETAIQLLDQQVEVEDRPIFLAGAGAWRSPHQMAVGGVRAVLEQACGWPPVLRERFALQFEPGESEARPSVSGLNRYWLEVACKTMFPAPHWLWS